MHVDVTATGMLGSWALSSDPSIILLISMLLVYFVINSSTHIYLLLKIRI